MAARKEIHSIVKASEVMKCLSDGINGLSDIARKLDYNKATVYRILQTLVTVGFTTQDPASQKYYPGPLLHRLTRDAVKAHQALSQCALIHMEALRDLVEETVLLQIQRGGQRILIAAVHAIRNYMYFAITGETNPINTGAGGRVLLAQLSEKELHLLLNDIPLVPLTSKTTTDKEQLTEQVRDVRLKGYSIEYGETTVEGGAIAVPIRNYICPAAISIVGITTRLQSNSETLLFELKKTAEQISNELVFIGK